MSPTGFRDLDELVLRCRDDRAAASIREAVLAYRGGAYRSAIVATWVAVAYDYLGKLRELALAGDPQAQQAVDEFEAIQEANDLAAALRWERDLLDQARSRFELLSAVELLDLKRLQEDRHRCAHPSMVSSDTPYAPSAELARTHIRNAVEAFLSHPPVQGKAALDRLMEEVVSPYFPLEIERAVTHFEQGPLRRPRRSLVRNFVILLLKGLLLGGQNWKRRQVFVVALSAVTKLHPKATEDTVAEVLPDLARRTLGGDGTVLVHVLHKLPHLWQALPVDVRQMLEELVKRLPSEEMIEIDDVLATSGLRAAALVRLKRATRAELYGRLPWADSDPDVISRKLAIYASAASFDAANAMAKVLVEDVEYFTHDHIAQVLDAAEENLQIRGSFGIASLLKAIVRAGKADGDKLRRELDLRELGSEIEM